LTGLKTAIAVIKELQEDLDIQASIDTVYHALQKAGLYAMGREK
jgi:hypothetical protein